MHVQVYFFMQAHIITSANMASNFLVLSKEYMQNYYRKLCLLATKSLVLSVSFTANFLRRFSASFTSPSTMTAGFTDMVTKCTKGCEAKGKLYACRKICVCICM